MRYIGNKLKLLSKIEEFIDENVKDDCLTFCDIFAGTGSVGSFFNKKYKIISNDYMYYSYVVNYGKLKYDGSFDFFKLKKHLNTDDIFKYLSDLEMDLNKTSGINFVYENYSEGNSDRKYFSKKNALKIDFIRKELDVWYRSDIISENEFFYLLMCLIESASKVSNTTGVYGAYLKYYDSRAVKNMEFLKILVEDFNNFENIIYNQYSNTLSETISGDIVYIDPPYTNQQYSDQYHVLETIAKYDNPEIKGITGKRKSVKSLYSYKRSAEETIDNLISNLDFKHIILSYNDKSIVSIDKMKEILIRYGYNLKYSKIEYNKYKNSRTENGQKNKKQLHEYLFYIQKY